MSAPRQPTRLSMAVFGAACIGAACSAPAPPPADEAAPADSADATAPTAAATPSSAAGPAPTAADTAPAPPPAGPPVRSDPPVPAAPAPRPAAPPPVNAAEPMRPSAPGVGASPATLTVTMLSRGKGVPEATRTAYKDIRALLEEQRSALAVTDMRTQRIGLEGETRLCVEFRSAKDAQAALYQIRQRAAGVELLDVSDAPCPSPKESKP